MDLVKVSIEIKNRKGTNMKIRTNQIKHSIEPYSTEPIKNQNEKYSRSATILLNFIRTEDTITTPMKPPHQ